MEARRLSGGSRTNVMLGIFNMALLGPSLQVSFLLPEGSRDYTRWNEPVEVPHEDIAAKGT